MKTIYRCETCGKEFNDTDDLKGWEACRDHEKVCEEKHATGIRLAKDINAAIKAADERGGVEIGVYCDDPRVYRLVKAKYDPRTGQVNLEIDADDRPQNIPQGEPVKTEGSDNGGN